jgi:hypothetical protein
MTFLLWLNQNYNQLKQLAVKIDNVNGEEVLHFTLEKFLTRTDTKFFDELEDNDKLKYLSRTLKLQATSETSQFYREFKRFTILSKDVILELEEEHYEENEIEQTKLRFIDEQLKQGNWFSSLLFKRYCETGYSAKRLAGELLIPLSTVQYHIRKVRTEIRTNWDKNKGKYGNN